MQWYKVLHIECFFTQLERVQHSQWAKSLKNRCEGECFLLRQRTRARCLNRKHSPSNLFFSDFVRWEGRKIKMSLKTLLEQNCTSNLPSKLK